MCWSPLTAYRVSGTSCAGPPVVWLAGWLRAGVRGSSRRILPQDERLQLAGLAARLESQLTGQHPAKILVAAQHVSLPAAPVERQHALRPQTLTQRVRGREHLKLGHELAAAAGGELGRDAQFEGLQPCLVQPRRLRPSERHVSQPARPAPQR